MKPTFDYTSKFKILKKGRVALALSATLCGATLSLAAPSGGVVSSGSATIEHSGKITNINQASDRASINWQKFGIKSDETVNFKQPDINSITLNRVVGNERSVIDGALNANGQVWILNSNGVLFGKNAKINTAGLLATTKELSDEDFNAGKYSFKGDSTASVINMGTIDISDSGYAVLLGDSVSNKGEIKAIKGTVHLTGAKEATINLNGNSLVDLVVDKGVLDALVENKGAIYADGGEIYLTTNAADELLKGVVNNEGIIEANSIDGLTGHVELFAHGGEVQVGGSITALEGFVETSGKEFTFNDAKIEAGEWLIDPVNVTIDEGLATAIEGQLANGDATITTVGGGSTPDTSSGESGSDGNIYVNSEITWDTAQKLTLDADNSIYINKAITASNANGQVALYYGDSGDYYISAPINLQAGYNFFTKKGSEGESSWRVITDLGDEGSSTRTDLQGINGNPSNNYALGADIDASVTSSWNNGDGFDPIGSDLNIFTGNFDGLSHVIDGLTINRNGTDYQGLFGYAHNAAIKNIGVTNVDIVGDTNIGGLVGSISGENSIIANAYTTGSVSGEQNVGGLIGQNAGTIKNSYALNTVSGANSKIGGLVGVNYGTIKHSYASNTVSGPNDDKGGLAGGNTLGAIVDSYYDIETNTELSMGDRNVLGKTQAEILSLAKANWDRNVWATGGSSYEGYVTDTFTLPKLKTFYTVTGGRLFNSGYGTEANPYTITNWTQLQNINHNSDTAGFNYKLSNNIGESTVGYENAGEWEPIGSNARRFTGNFDGQNYIIDRLKVDNSDDYQGLFGYVDRGNITNVALTNVDVDGISYTGGLVGWLAGSLSNSIVSGNIKGSSDYTGGLVGYSSSGIISNSYVSVSVKGNDYTGGLVGYSNSGSEIKNSYATGNVNGDNYVGGLTGFIVKASINNSYAANTVAGNSHIGGVIGINDEDGVITNSFYDNEINSGMDDSSFGKTTLELQSIDTFSDAGWNIEEDSSLASSYKYPVLSSFSGGGSTVWKIYTADTPTPTPDPDPTPTPDPDPTPDSTPTPTPTPTPSPTTVQEVETETENVDQVIITIVNQEATRPPKIELPSTQGIATNDIGSNVDINPDVIGKNTLISQPIEGQETRKVSMTEAKAMQIESGGSQEVRVPLSRDSIIELVDGGVNLPEGVEQEFYVSDEE